MSFAQDGHTTFEIKKITANIFGFKKTIIRRGAIFKGNTNHEDIYTFNVN